MTSISSHVISNSIVVESKVRLLWYLAKVLSLATQALISSTFTFRFSSATLYQFIKRSQSLLDSLDRREAIKSDNTYAGHHSREYQDA